MIIKILFLTNIQDTYHSNDSNINNDEENDENSDLNI